MKCGHLTCFTPNMNTIHSMQFVAVGMWIRGTLTQFTGCFIKCPITRYNTPAKGSKNSDKNQIGQPHAVQCFGQSHHIVQAPDITQASIVFCSEDGEEGSTCVSSATALKMISKEIWELQVPIRQQKGAPSEPPKMFWFVKKDVVKYTILLSICDGRNQKAKFRTSRSKQGGNQCSISCCFRLLGLITRLFLGINFVNAEMIVMLKVFDELGQMS